MRPGFSKPKLVTMQSLSDDEEKAILGEVLADQLKAIFEYVQDIPLIKRDIAIVKEDIRELKDGNAAFKVAMKDMGFHLDDHEHRIAKLEAA